jgi:type VI protein secretion system component VasK
MADVLNGTTRCPDLRPDDSLTVLSGLVTAFSSGAPLKHIRADVERLTMAQEERLQVVQSLQTQHAMIRMVRLMEARDRLERFLLSAAERSDLTPSEALVFLKMIQTDMPEIKAAMQPVPIKDTKATLDKVDFAQKIEAAETEKKYSDTTAQGREIIRKIIHGLVKQSSGKNTKPPRHGNSANREN